jgi:hypothetical protein
VVPAHLRSKNKNSLISVSQRRPPSCSDETQHWLLKYVTRAHVHVKHFFINLRYLQRWQLVCMRTDNTTSYKNTTIGFWNESCKVLWVKIQPPSFYCVEFKSLLDLFNFDWLTWRLPCSVSHIDQTSAHAWIETLVCLICRTSSFNERKTLRDQETAFKPHLYLSKLLTRDANGLQYCHAERASWYRTLT